jgi:hypothetical protein
MYTRLQAHNIRVGFFTINFAVWALMIYVVRVVL